MKQSIHGSLPHCPEGRWTRLPDMLISTLTPREHQLVHALLSYRWTDDAAIYPRVETLAERLNCSARTIQRTARGLESKGYLIIEARYRDDQGQTSNLYRPGPLLVALLPPPGDTATATPRHDQRPLVTRPAAERDSGNQRHLNRGRQQGYIRVETDPRAFTGGELGAYIHQ